MTIELGKEMPIVADQETLRAITQEALSVQYHNAQHAINDENIEDLKRIARKFRRRLMDELNLYKIELLPDDE